MAEQNPQVVMRAGPIPGSKFFLTKDEIVLGRDLSSDIPVPDPEISRRHARLVRKPEGIYIEDLGSTNGTFLNGVRISSPQLLKHGDLITLAESTVMGFESAGSSVPSYTEVPHVAQEAYHPEAPAPAPTPIYQPIQAPTPSRPVAPAPSMQKPKQKMGWCSIVLLILLISLILIGLVLVFMPGSWWCALTFNAISGCPVP
ncbi:MAG: FHA domain-containing protein [Anaerolineaceae bacterium]|jgi:hypothetical protein